MLGSRMVTKHYLFKQSHGICNVFVTVSVTERTWRLTLALMPLFFDSVSLMLSDMTNSSVSFCFPKATEPEVTIRHSRPWFCSSATWGKASQVMSGHRARLGRVIQSAHWVRSLMAKVTGSLGQWERPLGHIMPVCYWVASSGQIVPSVEGSVEKNRTSDDEFRSGHHEQYGGSRPHERIRHCNMRTESYFLLLSVRWF